MKTASNVSVAAVKCIADEGGKRKVKTLLINLHTKHIFEVRDESLLEIGSEAVRFDYNAPFLIFGNEDIRIKDFTLQVYSSIGHPSSNFDLNGATPEDIFNCQLPATLQCYEIFQLFFEEWEEIAWLSSKMLNLSNLFYVQTCDREEQRNL